MDTAQLSFEKLKKEHIPYTSAISNINRGEEAVLTLLYRFGENNGKKPIATECNVATVTLLSNGRQPKKIQITMESSGTKMLAGHSERRSLAIAINQAIKEGITGFAGRPEIKNTTMPSPDELKSFKEALQSLNLIKIYTERIPCGRPKESEQPCDLFFAELFQKINYKFYYSVPLNTGFAMTKDLDVQASMARDAYVVRGKEELIHVSSQIEKLEKEISMGNDEVIELQKQHRKTQDETQRSELLASINKKQQELLGPKRQRSQLSNRRESLKKAISILGGIGAPVVPTSPKVRPRASSTSSDPAEAPMPKQVASTQSMTKPVLNMDVFSTAVTLPLSGLFDKPPTLVVPQMKMTDTDALPLEALAQLRAKPPESVPPQPPISGKLSPLN